jgi:hypothetical protein
MTYLEEIIAEINNAIVPELPSDNINSVGLAMQMVRVEGEKRTIFPCYVDKDGEGVYVGPDDDHDIIIYHRVNTITVARSTNLGKQGDSRGADVHIANVVLILFAQRNKVKIGSDDMAIIVQANMPDAMEKAWIQNKKFFAANINITEMSLNSMAVFNEEYSNVEFFLKPEQYLIKVTYKIESAFLKKCFKKCGC